MTTGHWYLDLAIGLILSGVIAFDHKLAKDPRYKANATLHFLLDLLDKGLEGAKAAMPAASGLSGVIERKAEDVIDTAVEAPAAAKKAPDKPLPNIM